MSRIERPQVTDLSDLEWARIERAIWQRLDAASVTAAPAPLPHRHWLRPLMIGAAATVLVAAGLLWWLLVPNPRTDGDAPDTLARMVTADAPTAISFADASIEIAARSAISLSRTSATVSLERGSARFTVAPRRQRPAFLVVAGDATVRVIGTRFEVQRRAEEVVVSVQEGTVEVLFRGALHSLFAGGSWTSAPSASSAPSAPSPPPATIARVDAGVMQQSAATPAPPVPPTSRPAPSARDRFEAATQLEPRDPQRALREYLRLSRRADAWGANALYAAARLAFDIGQPAHGAELARSYLQRFPSGGNAADIAALLAGAEFK
jgi:hypothetical protein